MAGYRSRQYAKSLSEFGDPWELPASGGWLLRRKVAGNNAWDGTSYPLFSCSDWSLLASDLELRDGKLVSFSAVVDPFGTYSRRDLERAFPDLILPFKDHFVADLSKSIDTIISLHNRKAVARAWKRVDVEIATEPLPLLDTWITLFKHAIDKFSIRGIRRYSKQAFAMQLAMPDTSMTVARVNGVPVAAHIQILCDGVVYAHAAAAAPLAYKVGAAHALYAAELEYFRDKARWIDWGGEAGLAADGSLASFKRGWSTGVRQSSFCGRIMDRRAYDRLSKTLTTGRTGYFPIYRAGEFE